MKVELREQIGRNIATGKPEKVPHYRVFVDGRAVGHIGFKESSTLFLLAKFGPIEKRQIEDKVGQLIGRNTESVSAPDVPPEMLNTDEEMIEDDSSDFD